MRFCTKTLKIPFNFANLSKSKKTNKRYPFNRYITRFQNPTIKLLLNPCLFPIYSSIDEVKYQLQLSPVYTQNHATHLLWPLIQEGFRDSANIPFSFLRTRSFWIKSFTACTLASAEKYFVHCIAEALEGIQDGSEFEVIYHITTVS